MNKYNIVVEDRLWRNIEVEAETPEAAVRAVMDMSAPQVVLENRGGPDALWYDGESDVMDVFYKDDDAEWGIYPEHVVCGIKQFVRRAKEREATN